MNWGNLKKPRSDYIEQNEWKWIPWYSSLINENILIPGLERVGPGIIAELCIVAWQHKPNMPIL